MSEKKNPLGPTGETVRKNVIRLRGGMQYKDLAERLVAIGRPIPALGLRRIEAGERRVDADDLVALAVAFGVSPLTILLPEDGTKFAASPMTGVVGRRVSHNTQWLWGLGQEPLSLPGEGKGEDAQREISLFRVKAKPEVEPRTWGHKWVPQGSTPEEIEAESEEMHRISWLASYNQGLMPERVEQDRIKKAAEAEASDSK
jgi:transcriptional regulator with XRE-family HTH domain